MKLRLPSLPQFSNPRCFLIIYQRILKIITEIVVVLKGHLFLACYKLRFRIPLVFMCVKLNVAQGKMNAIKDSYHGQQIPCLSLYSFCLQILS